MRLLYLYEKHHILFALICASLILKWRFISIIHFDMYRNKKNPMLRTNSEIDSAGNSALMHCLGIYQISNMTTFIDSTVIENMSITL